MRSLLPLRGCGFYHGTRHLLDRHAPPDHAPDLVFEDAAWNALGSWGDPARELEQMGLGSGSGQFGTKQHVAFPSWDTKETGTLLLIPGLTVTLF
jgi:hypothetical protein